MSIFTISLCPQSNYKYHQEVKDLEQDKGRGYQLKKRSKGEGADQGMGRRGREIGIPCFPGPFTRGTQGLLALGKEDPKGEEDARKGISEVPSPISGVGLESKACGSFPRSLDAKPGRPGRVRESLRRVRFC